MTNPDNASLKQIQHDQWAAAADGWRRRDELLKKGAAPVTSRMLELAQITQGSHLLDIASGTGEPALSAARMVGETGRVVGTDLVDQMLGVARDKAAAQGLQNIEFVCSDGETLEVAPCTMDAVTIRWGLMFMPQPRDCLVLARAALKDNGRLSLACWAAPEKNPFMSLLMQTLGNYMDVPAPPPGTPGVFALADPDRLHDVIASAGFGNIVLEEFELEAMDVADGQAYWEAISDLAAPIMALVNQLDATARGDYIVQVIKQADALKQGDRLCMKGTTWIASADK